MSHRTPSYRLHMPTGQAVVTVGGRDVYLGKHGTSASRAEYDRILSEWLASGRGRASPGGSNLSVSELMVLYLRHAGDYYRDPDGGPGEELSNIRDAIRPLKRLYGHTEAVRFGPLAFKAVREALIEAGLRRSTIHGRMGRVRRMFKWAAANEHVPPSVFHGLRAVEGPKAGRGKARESVPVRPVSDEHVAAVLPFVSAPVRAMIELQSACGARPGEIARMRACDVDRTADVGIYRPRRHETQGKGRTREIPLGPRAREILAPWLEVAPGAFLFSPAVAVARRNAEKRRNRKSPMTPSQAARRPRANPKRPPRNRYDEHGYRQAISRACVEAGIPNWHPHQLRHAVATRIRAAYGLEAAQVVLGHSRADVTQVCAERDLTKAVRVTAEVG